MDKLLVTVIPCGLVVISLLRLLQLIKEPRASGSLFSLCLSAGVSALSLLWASVAVGHGMAAAPLSEAFRSASWALGPVLGGLFVAALYAGPALERVRKTLSREAKSSPGPRA